MSEKDIQEEAKGILALVHTQVVADILEDGNLGEGHILEEQGTGAGHTAGGSLLEERWCWSCG